MKVDTTNGARLPQRPTSHGARRALARPPCPRRLPFFREGTVAARSRRGHLRFPLHSRPPSPGYQHCHAARHVRAQKGGTAVPQCFSTAGRAHCPRGGGTSDCTTAAALSPAAVWPEGEVHRGRLRLRFPRKRTREPGSHCGCCGTGSVRILPCK